MSASEWVRVRLSWVAYFVVAVLGGVLGSYATLIAQGTPWGWSAFGAIATALGAFATLVAVLVALYPILRDEERRQAASVALRTMTLVHLTHLRGYLSRCHAAGAPVPEGSQLFEQETARKSLKSILQLMPRSKVLDAEDQRLLAAAIGTCEGVRAGLPVPREHFPFVIENLLGLVSGVYDQFAHGIGFDAERQSKAAERFAQATGTPPPK